MIFQLIKPEIRRPTPGYENDRESIMLSCPSFSFESGFYEEEFDLEILMNSEIPIYYTTDGSEPNVDSYLYMEPIHVYDRSDEENAFRNIQNVVANWENYQPDKTPVEKAFLIKAKAIDQAGNYSDTVTGIYYIKRDKAREVLSIIADPEDLFGENGIYVTGKEYDDWYTNTERLDSAPICNFSQSHEIPATVFYFEEGDLCLEQNVGLRIQGAASRGNALKRFSLFARDKYDEGNRFLYPMVEGRQGHSYFLRDGFSNMFIQSLVKDRNVAVAGEKLVSVFLNGEYWYDAYLNERLDTIFFSDKYDVPEEDIFIVKNEEFDEEMDFYLGNPYFELKYFADDNDLGVDENYNEISNMMDIQSYIDFACINIYCANEDVGERKNYIAWHSENRKTGGFSDGRWRWALHDMDALDWMIPEDYGVEHQYEINTFSQDTITAGAPFSQTTFFRNLKKNDDFCEQFVLTFMDLVNENFSVGNVTKELEKYGEDITWRDSFFLKRADYIVPALADEFDLKGELSDIYITINNQNYGYVKVNTIEPDMSEGSWTGSYFGDYPIIVTAIANPGYKFVGWKGDVLSPQTTVEVDLSKGDKSIEALFREID